MVNPRKRRDHIERKGFRNPHVGGSNPPVGIHPQIYSSYKWDKIILYWENKLLKSINNQIIKNFKEYCITIRLSKPRIVFYLVNLSIIDSIYWDNKNP
jgi:hypothetical protein